MRDLAPPPYTFADLLGVWRRHRGTIVGTFFLILLPGLLVVFLMPPVFEARATLLVSRESRAPQYSVKAAQPDGATLMRSVERKEEINTEAELLKSRSVVESVVQKQELNREKLDRIHDFRRYVRAAYVWLLDTAVWAYDEAKFALGLSRRPSIEEQRVLYYERLVNNAMGRVKVVVVPDSNIVQVSFRSSDPFLARDVVNDMTATYLGARARIRDANAEGFFLDQTERMAADLETKEAELERLKQEVSVYSAEEQRRLTVAAMVSADTTLKATQTALVSARARAAALRSQLSAQPSTLIASRETDRNPTVDQLGLRIIDMQVRRTNLAQNFQGESTTLKIADGELEAAKQLRQTVPATLDGTVIETVNPIFQDLRRDLLAAEAEEAARTAELRAVSQHVASLREELAALNRSEVQLKTLERAVSTQTEAYLLYSKNREQARVVEDMAAARLAAVHVVDPASLPIRTVRPRPLIYSGIVLAASMAMALFAGFIAAYHDTRVASEVEAALLLGLPVIASFPLVEGRSAPARRALSRAG